jgi:cytochrome P450
MSLDEGDDVATWFSPGAAGQDINGLHAILARARHEAPVFHWPTLDMWVVTRHDDVLAVLRDPVTFSNRGILNSIDWAPETVAALTEAGVADMHHTRWMGTLDDPEHQMFRSSVNRSFTPRRVAALEPQVRTIASALADGFGSPTDFVRAFAYPLPIRVILAFIHVAPDDMDDLQRWTDDLTRLMTQPMPVDEQLGCATSVIKLDRYVGALIDERRHTPGDDFLSAVVQDAEAGNSEWGEAELRHLVAHGLILAGHETTKAALAAGLRQLLEVPERWTEVVTNRAVIPAVVEEALRFDPPLIGFFRRTTAEAKLSDVIIPADARVYFAVASANLDERRYGCPSEFRLDRGPDEQFHTTFGNGTHFCLGAPLARLEMRVAFDVLADRFPDMRLDPERPPRYKPNPVIHHLEQLWVRPS